MTTALPSPQPSERRALIGAGVAHVLLFGALSLGWAWQSATLPPAEEMVPVDFVDIADAPRVTKAPEKSIEAAPQETAAPAPAEPAPATPEPAPTDAVPPPEPVPKPEKKPLKAAADKPAEAKPLDTGALSNLIDKSLPKSKVKPLDISSLATQIAAATPKQAVIDPRAAATLAQAIRAQVAPCWNVPIGGRDVRKMTVLIRADFARDGSVIGVPRVVSQTGATAANSDYARAFAETAKRAVLRCA
ncbi:MAG: hypothetical protein ACKVON_03430, partial [Beijerinckiaceae bacterium]